MKFADIPIRVKLIAAFIIVGVLPLITVEMYGNRITSASLLVQSMDEINTIQSMRKGQIENAFAGFVNDLKILSASERLKSLNEELEEYRRKTRTLPTLPFNVESTKYREIYEKYGAEYQYFVETYGYHDLKVISYYSGHVMFSVAGDKDLGTNLIYGRYKESGLADLWREVVETEKIGVVDFNPYEPSGGEEALLIGAPLFNAAGGIDSVIILQLDPAFINAIMRSREGLGTTGESYLIAHNNKTDVFEFRSNMTTMGKGNYIVGFAFPQPPEYWYDAIRKDLKKENRIYQDSAGKEVLVTYDRLSIHDLEWFLISKIDKSEVLGLMDNLLRQGLLLALFLCLFIFACALSFARQIVRPIIAGMQFAQSISMGDLEASLTLEQKDELGMLAKSLNNMAGNLRDLDWLKRGKEGLDDRLRGEAGLESLGLKFISFLVEHMGGELGAFYLYEESRLQLIACHGFTGQKNRFGELQLGEGLVGQAAIELRIKVFSGKLSTVPEFNYGGGQEPPPYHFAAPLVLEGKLLGAFWVGSFAKFTELHNQFVTQNMKSVAIFIRMARSRRTIEELYEKSQAQHEELRVTNEELKERTEDLQESQEHMVAQQEELRVTNEELQERTETLEKQKQSLNDKTLELIKARKEIELKAMEVERGSRYKSEFLANMSHELRTPLNSIIILSQMLAEDNGDNLKVKQVESAKTIYSSGVELLLLIDEILDLSKVEAGKVDLTFEEIQLEQIGKDISRLFRDLAEEKNLQFSIHISEDLPSSLYTDGQRLQQILRNLLANAFKFTREGTVSLTISRPPSAIPLSQNRRERLLAFSVRDEGIGIPKKRQEEIFKAFQQADGSTSRNYGGTGLGLSISKELTRLLGGTIHLQSKEGEGSVFTILLPEGGDDENEVQVSRALESELSFGDKVEDIHGDDSGATKTDENQGLLIVGSTVDLQQRMSKSALGRGFNTIFADSGEQGLHYADFFKPRAIIIEDGLSGMKGREILKRLKESPLSHGIPVFIITTEEAAIDKEIEQMVSGLVSTPVSQEQIEDLMDSVFAVMADNKKRLLVVEKDRVQAEAIEKLVASDDISTTLVMTGDDAIGALQSSSYDCMILDLGLDDMDGDELLERKQQCQKCADVPVIVYTARSLSRAEEEKLRKTTKSIIIKGAKSPERLLEDVALFCMEDQPKPAGAELAEQSRRQPDVFIEKTILIVDDDMRNVFALSNLLEEKGVQIVVARDGLESLEKLQESEPIDLVLMDIMMPKMDGYEAITKIRNDLNLTKVPIIALTAKAMKGDRAKCIEAGANDYLAKPVDTERLLSMLKVWLY